LRGKKGNWHFPQRNGLLAFRTNSLINFFNQLFFLKTPEYT